LRLADLLEVLLVVLLQDFQVVAGFSYRQGGRAESYHHFSESLWRLYIGPWANREG